MTELQAAELIKVAWYILYVLCFIAGVNLAKGK